MNIRSRSKALLKILMTVLGFFVLPVLIIKSNLQFVQILAIFSYFIFFFSFFILLFLFVLFSIHSKRTQVIWTAIILWFAVLCLPFFAGSLFGPAAFNATSIFYQKWDNEKVEQSFQTFHNNKGEIALKTILINKNQNAANAMVLAYRAYYEKHGGEWLVVSMFFGLIVVVFLIVLNDPFLGVREDNGSKYLMMTLLQDEIKFRLKL